MAEEAGTKALEPTRASPTTPIEQAAVGYCYGDSTCGQRAVYQLGLTGVPIYNVNNNCATGSTALFMAKQFVEAASRTASMALGFEKMEKGSLGIKYTDRTNPMDKHAKVMIDTARLRQGAAGAAVLRQRRPRAHGEVRHHRRAVRQDRLEEPQALGQQPVLAVPGRVLARGHPERARWSTSRSPSCSAAPPPTAPAPRCCASEDFVKQHGLQDKAVEIARHGDDHRLRTRAPSTRRAAMKLVGYDMTRDAAKQGLRAERSSAPRTWTWSSCTTASRPTS